MVDKEISVLLSADDRYARYCAVTILSILENTSSPDKFHFYVLSPDISAQNINKLQQLCNQFNSILSVIPINLSLFQDLPAFHEHFNLNNYSRLCGPDLCEDSEIIIYLDCDIVVLGDIANLCKYQLNGKPIGAVPHVKLPYQETFIKNFSIDDEDIYFNSGVMLIDSINWRHNQYSQTVIKCCIENPNKLHFADQDALNAVFWRNYCHLPGMWNVEARLYKEKLLGLPQNEEITQRMQNPQIIHYTGSDKPWVSENYVPMRHLYTYYSEQLSKDFSWVPSTKEPKKCSISSCLKFIWSCLYFRASYSFHRILNN